jgi:hypothetical protein
MIYDTVGTGKFSWQRRWKFSIVPSDPGDEQKLYAEINTLFSIYDGATANFSVQLDHLEYYQDNPNVYGFKFGGEKARKEDPPNSECERTFSVIS